MNWNNLLTYSANLYDISGREPSRRVPNINSHSGEASLAKCSPPLVKCLGHSLKLLDTVQKIWAPLRKLFAPPRVLNWLPARVHLQESKMVYANNCCMN